MPLTRNIRKKKYDKLEKYQRLESRIRSEGQNDLCISFLGCDIQARKWAFVKKIAGTKSKTFLYKSWQHIKCWGELPNS